jgi:hypothetical protein
MCLSLLAGCDPQPQTNVVLENAYPQSGATPLVVFRAHWQAASFQQPLLPGSVSEAQSTVPASANVAYVLLAPGWDPDASPTTPTSFVLMQSRTGFEVHLNDTLHIRVNDTTFIGNCAAGSPLTQDQADFIVQRVFNQNIFPGAFAAFSYDAESCTTSLIGDTGGH